MHELTAAIEEILKKLTTYVLVMSKLNVFYL